MVAQQSPKLFVRVRILVPVPHKQINGGQAKLFERIGLVLTLSHYPVRGVMPILVPHFY
jgi:hypothetical protein